MCINRLCTFQTDFYVKILRAVFFYSSPVQNRVKMLNSDPVVLKAEIEPFASNFEDRVLCPITRLERMQECMFAIGISCVHIILNPLPF